MEMQIFFNTPLLKKRMEMMIHISFYILFIAYITVLVLLLIETFVIFSRKPHIIKTMVYT